jgi:hypothetical protein
MYRILSFVDVHLGFMVANIRLPSYTSLGKLNLYLCTFSSGQNVSHWLLKTPHHSLVLISSSHDGLDI